MGSASLFPVLVDECPSPFALEASRFCGLDVVSLLSVYTIMFLLVCGIIILLSQCNFLANENSEPFSDL